MCNTKEAAAHFPKGKIQLRYCKDCGYIGNEAYESGKVTFDNYDFSNDFSLIFSAYVHELCNQLISQYDLREKIILDVGCGDGYFLKTMCRLGNNKGIGIDSGFNHSKRPVEDDLDIQFFQDYYSAKYNNLQPDFVSCRLVIDLLPDPIGFLKIFRENLMGRPDTIVFFEVPYTNYTFEQNVIWNVVYEHRSWFTKASFSHLFESCGFEVIDLPLLWNDEFLGLVAKIKSYDAASAPTQVNRQDTLWKTIDKFSESYQNQLEKYKLQIEQIRKNYSKIAAWGAGARGVSFFNLYKLNDLVTYVVDINEKRQGKFIPGSGQEIVSPEYLKTYQPDLIIITNPSYAEEIKAQARALGAQSDFWVL